MRPALTLAVLLTTAPLVASPVTLQVCVKDPTGLPIAGATITLQPASATPIVTSASGCITLQADPAIISATSPGFASTSVPWNHLPTVLLTLQPERAQEHIEVTAARTPLALEANASSVRTLSTQQLNEAPGLTLDDRLRQVAGFQLFRRTSSQVANPTTEGTSLRGLGSTAASRTLVLSDQVPLNDAYGGWIHWNEIPQLAIQSVELVRGGASDLYGSSAIGGVIDVHPTLPATRTLAADLSGATEDTFALNGLASAAIHRASALAATSIVRSDGYTLIAPAFRGAVDVASTVRSQSGRIELRHLLGPDGDVFLRGNLLNEVRGNGTPIQTNATRIWRYAVGLDAPSNPFGRFFLRAYGDDQGYRQSFSTIATNRASETLSRLQRTPSQQLGFAAQWARSLHAFTFVAGADALDTRARDDETAVSKGINQPVVTISSRQRDIGGYGELLWQPLGAHPLTSGWSAALSGRVDRFRDFDAHQNGGSNPGPLPQTDETVFNPRLGLVKQAGSHLSLTGSVFRAYRGPTMNELYRTGQVGQQITQANPSLLSERATGFELGTLLTGHRLGSLRTSYFWTQVNRPIAALTITPVLLQRENLGQLESRGVTAEGTTRLAPWASITGGYQFALSTITRYQPDPTFLGKWTAEVPRNSATAQLRLERPRWGTLAIDALVSGKSFDDSANTFELHGYTQLNAYAEHRFAERLRLYASARNLFDRSIDAGRTPILTLASPRTVLAGIRLQY